VNPLDRLPLLPLTVTVTVTGPALPAGVVAVMDVLLPTTTLVAAVPPKVTVAPVAKFVPVIVTAVPPAVEPLFGDTLVTIGVSEPAPMIGTITPNQGVLPPVHVVVAVWVPTAVTAFASFTNPGLVLGATVIPVYPAPAAPVKAQHGI
jgi:hypothetical protein